MNQSIKSQFQFIKNEVFACLEAKCLFLRIQQEHYILFKIKIQFDPLLVDRSLRNESVVAVTPPQ